jgi:hypothetical protein
MALVTELADDRTIFAHEGVLFVCVWRGAPTAPHMKALGEIGRRVEAQAGPLALLNVAIGGVPTFDDEVRKTAVAYTRDAGLFGCARAHVIEMTGFTGVAVLAFVNTFLLLGRPPRPTKVFRATGEAVRWLAPFLPPPWTAERVQATLAEARARLGDAPAPPIRKEP